MIVNNNIIEQFLNSMEYNILITSKIHELEYIDAEVIEVGLVLSKKLLEYPESERQSLIVELLKEIVEEHRSDILILKDSEILFNPYYGLDVVKQIKSLSRNSKIILVWPGIISDNELIFAEPGYEDYYRYKIDKDLLIERGEQ